MKQFEIDLGTISEQEIESSAMLSIEEKSSIMLMEIGEEINVLNRNLKRVEDIDTSDRLCWEIEDYSTNVISLMQDGQLLFMDRITIKDIEAAIGKKLRVARSYENPQFVVGARVQIGDKLLIDTRAQKRGSLIRYYVINS